ncbi:phosphate/phosphite/phosphonate ABC transporter substrate-binding protein [Tepidiphilus sp. J10]|uniref:phosphate/phosphite/phosphonate ABC transporter substrate-binding protein n=1 Tax=Tepidiphilus sp. J10 TaxID=2502185 RepID=UPI00115D30C3|nr:PhnD/SsuA/transferrin family substrate-binding protein [Tepidiphilus sp. J10]
MESRTNLVRRRWVQSLMSLAIGGIVGVRAAEEAQPLRFGIQPFRTAEVLLTLHKGLLDTLAQALGRPLRFSTRPTYDAYTKALLAGEFDLAIMPPHVAVWLATRDDWELEAKYEVRLAALLAARDAPPSITPEALRGRRIALGDPDSIVALVARETLDRLGLVPQRDFTLVLTASHGASMQALVNGSVDYAIVANTVHAQFRAKYASLHAVPFGPDVPHLMTGARRSLPEALRARFRATLLSFHETEAGRQFFAETGYRRFVPVTEADFAEMAPFLPILDRLYASSPEPAR